MKTLISIALIILLASCDQHKPCEGYRYLVASTNDDGWTIDQRLCADSVTYHSKEHATVYADGLSFEVFAERIKLIDRRVVE